MKEIVFLLEEDSAKAMLDALLPRILDVQIGFRCIPFEGKQDLEKQMVKRIRGYQNPEARFIIVRDQDSHPDCRAVKQRLLEKCHESGKAESALVRIACRELETFYLADLAAVESGLNLSGLKKHQNTRKFRQPDLLISPSLELLKLTKNAYQKVSGSRKIGKFLDMENTRSLSFRNLVLGIRKQAEMLMAISG
ncbi:DUF4276 family protein [Propionivibrio sp.]|uniref:DUF4276 family protein n=1 Tax=Propionivibrio sp. TaxID=2212460 RepID=UPI003BF26782